MSDKSSAIQEILKAAFPSLIFEIASHPEAADREEQKLTWALTAKMREAHPDKEFLARIRRDVGWVDVFRKSTYEPPPKFALPGYQEPHLIEVAFYDLAETRTLSFPLKTTHIRSSGSMLLFGNRWNANVALVDTETMKVAAKEIAMATFDPTSETLLGFESLLDGRYQLCRYDSRLVVMNRGPIYTQLSGLEVFTNGDVCVCADRFAHLAPDFAELEVADLYEIFGEKFGVAPFGFSCYFEAESPCLRVKIDEDLFYRIHARAATF